MTKPLISLLLAALTLLTVAGCGASPKSADPNSAKPSIVTSTSMWAAVATAIAGDHAAVKAIIANPNQDPHDYEATAQDKLAFDQASVILVNGGGYDDWATTVATSLDADSKLLDAVKVANLPGTGTPDFNEHIWYSLPAVKAVATQLSSTLSTADPDHAGDYATNLTAFTKALDGLQTKAKQVGADHRGASYVSTEPVAVHLFSEMGLTDQTPEAFTEQSESDAGPSVAVLNQTLTLVRSGKLSFLAVNPQTEDGTSKQLITAATQAKTPTVEVYETLPESAGSYVGFMTTQLDAIARALG